MSRTLVHNLSISLDGFATGEPQSAEAPFGHAGQRLHEWMFATRFWTLQTSSDEDGSVGVDDAFAGRHGLGVGTEIMGAHTFGPPGWQDDPDWRGWWGPDPPPTEALATARAAAGGLDVRIGGGPTVVRDFLAARLVDHADLVQVPVVLGRGVRLWDGLEGLEDDYTVEAVASPSGVTHLTLTLRSDT